MWKKLGSFLDYVLLQVAANLGEKTNLKMLNIHLKVISIELNKDLELTKNKDI